MKFLRGGEEDEFAEPDRPRRKKPNVILTLIVDALAVAVLLSILLYVTFSKRQEEKTRPVPAQNSEAAPKAPAPGGGEKADIPAQPAIQETMPAAQDGAKQDQPAQAQSVAAQHAHQPPEKSHTPASPPNQAGQGAPPTQSTGKIDSFTDNEIALQRGKSTQAIQSPSPLPGETSGTEVAAKAGGPSPAAPARIEPKPAPALEKPPVAAPVATAATKPAEQAVARIQTPPPPPAPKPSKPEPAAAPPVAPAPSAQEKTAAAPARIEPKPAPALEKPSVETTARLQPPPPPPAPKPSKPEPAPASKPGYIPAPPGSTAAAPAAAKPADNAAARGQAPPPSQSAKPSKPEPAPAPPVATAPSAPEKAGESAPAVEKKSLVIFSAGSGRKEQEQPPAPDGAKSAPPEPGKKSVVLFSSRGAEKSSTTGDAALEPQPAPASAAGPKKQIVILSGKSGAPAPERPERTAESAKPEAPAQEPAEEAKPSAQEGVKSPSRGGYRLRFALCHLRENCEAVRSSLAKAGVTTTLEKGTSDFNTYHAMLGPMQTSAHARHAAEELAKLGIRANMLVSGDKYYLVTEAELSEASAASTLKKSRDAGVDGKTYGKRESLEVYKVYGESFDKRNAARQRREHYRKLGFDCMVEE